MTRLQQNVERVEQQFKQTKGKEDLDHQAALKRNSSGSNEHTGSPGEASLVKHPEHKFSRVSPYGGRFI